MKTSTKLISSIALVIVTVVTTGYFSVSLISQISDSVNVVTKREYPVNESLSNYQRGSFQLWVGTYTYGNDRVMGRQIIKNGKKMMEESRKELSGVMDSSVFNELESKEIGAIESSDNVVKSYEDRSLQEENINVGSSTAIALFDYEKQIKFNSSLLQQKVSSLNLALTGMVDESQVRINSEIDSLDNEVNRAIQLAIVFAIITVLITILIGLYIILSIVGPLNQLNKVTDFITDGNFDAALPTNIKNKEIASLVGSIEMLLSVVRAKKGK